MTLRASRAAAVALVSAAFSLWGAAAWAEPTAADRESARAVMKEGDAAMAKKDFAAARRAYAEAHRLVNVPTTGRELARAEEALGNFLEAKDVCGQVTRLAPAPGEPPLFDAARKECAGIVAALDKRLATLRIAIRAPSVESVKITLDGVPVQGPTATRRVNPGPHEIAASGPGLAPQKRSVSTTGGETKDILIDLEPEVGAALPPAASSAAPLGSVAPISTAPPAGPPPPAEVAPRSNTAAYVLLGVGGAAILVGSVAGVLALSDNTKAQDACPTRKGCSPDAIDRQGSATTKAWIANGGIGGGLILGGIGVVLLLTRPSAPATAIHRYYIPTLLPGGAGAVMGGSF